jgi:hypothetical protein
MLEDMGYINKKIVSVNVVVLVFVSPYSQPPGEGAPRAVADGPVSLLRVNIDGEITDAYAARMKNGKIVPP